jgi:hypothetical protein
MGLLLDAVPVIAAAVASIVTAITTCKLAKIRAAERYKVLDRALRDAPPEKHEAIIRELRGWWRGWQLPGRK